MMEKSVQPTMYALAKEDQAQVKAKDLVMRTPLAPTTNHPLASSANVRRASWATASSVNLSTLVITHCVKRMPDATVQMALPNASVSQGTKSMEKEYVLM